MKKELCVFAGVLCLGACAKEVEDLPEKGSSAVSEEISLAQVAKMLSCLPVGNEQIGEVYDAVSNSSEEGYDEEYLMKDLFNNPGAGVGGTKAGKNYTKPLRSMIREYLEANPSSKGPAEDVEAYAKALEEAGMQIYWPYSEDWDGKTYPVITFNPGYGAESNYGYEISIGQGGVRIVDSIYVDENVAKSRPVWVVNTNDDSAFTPMDMVEKTKASSSSASSRMLMLKSFNMLRNYDSWFAGASEFWIKCGSVTGFKASTEAELKNYQPSVTDMVVVVKRKYKGVPYEMNSILISDFTDQIENVAFLVTEDDGGTTTSWKCSATVKIKSKSYGFELDIPYNDKDDIVWRGQLSSKYLTSSDIVTARLGDTEVTFEIL